MLNPIGTRCEAGGQAGRKPPRRLCDQVEVVRRGIVPGGPPPIRCGGAFALYEEFDKRAVAFVGRLQPFCACDGRGVGCLGQPVRKRKPIALEVVGCLTGRIVIRPPVCLGHQHALVPNPRPMSFRFPVVVLKRLGRDLSSWTETPATVENAMGQARSFEVVTRLETLAKAHAR